MSKLKVTFELDQPLFPETEEILKECLKDGLYMYSSFDISTVKIEEVEK